MSRCTLFCTTGVDSIRLKALGRDDLEGVVDVKQEESVSILIESGAVPILKIY